MHIAQGKGLIAPGAAAEQAQDLIGEKPEAERFQRADDKGVAVDHIGGLLYPFVISGPEVEAHDRLSAYAAAYDGGVEKEIDFCDDAGGCKRLTSAVFGQGAVMAQGAVEDQVHDQHGRLIEAARRSNRHDLGNLAAGHGKMLPQQLPRFKAKQICDDQDRGCHLAKDRRDRGARNAHIQGKEEEIIQDKIQDDARHRADQGIAGAAVRADQKSPS